LAKYSDDGGIPAGRDHRHNVGGGIYSGLISSIVAAASAALKMAAVHRSMISEKLEALKTNKMASNGAW